MHENQTMAPRKTRSDRAKRGFQLFELDSPRFIDALVFALAVLEDEFCCTEPVEAGATADADWVSMSAIVLDGSAVSSRMLDSGGYVDAVTLMIWDSSSDRIEVAL